MYATVMNGLSKRGHTEKTFSLFRLMEQGSTKPYRYIYSIVIDALCKDRMLDAVVSLLNEMKQKGLVGGKMLGLCSVRWLVNVNIYPNVYTFSIVIDGLCKEEKVEDAEKIMRHMIRKGEEPTVVTYNAIADGYCLRGQID
ncbi:putative pentatricopeptide repeat-containing protein At1g12700, mitochondrial [Nicotiana tomentosiformis]|uniref:putative pentatricopeptide repeat-containing protein At1g12700, mitochondrial n=1 Tax=Nicotiana tomentosiformis TaxID=4098 RepID=UPI00388C4359